MKTMFMKLCIGALILTTCVLTKSNLNNSSSKEKMNNNNNL